MSRVKIIVATHKKYQMPNDPMYLPLHVGAEGKVDGEGNPLDLGYQKDNTGDNISYLNPSFCELTGLYWAWKNLDDDYIGLAHYRRHFRGTVLKEGFDAVLKERQLRPMFGRYRVFVPLKRYYMIETLYSHYAHTHYSEQLDITRGIIQDKYPDYLPAYDKVVKKRSGYMFNMMIMERKLLNDYCEWLFDILFELRKQVKTEDLSAFQGRLFGRISEILLNVWLKQQRAEGRLRRSEIKMLPYMHMEKLNHRKKLRAFLAAKFFHRRYEGSF
ncbi:MAG: DUF4422 domain-containing protein [Dorea sp.]|nr:DUF4422 domain-containing protein [Dorea sp.]